MFDFRQTDVVAYPTKNFDLTGLQAERPANAQDAQGFDGFAFAKRAFDILVSLVLLPVLAVAAVVLLILNPFMNKGSLWFVQVRMGKDCKAFAALKFRSMKAVGKITRGADDPLETDRISSLVVFYVNRGLTSCRKSSTC